MVVDTSALLVFAYGEAEHGPFGRAIESDGTRLISAVSDVEASIVVIRRAGPDGHFPGRVGAGTTGVAGAPRPHRVTSRSSRWRARARA